MRIAFLDFHDTPYDPDTPLVRPTGGSQSAVAYLSAELAALGHQVLLINAGEPRLVRGVHCVGQAGIGAVADQDAVVVVNLARPDLYQSLRAAMQPEAKLVLWTGHAWDQPPIQALADPALRRMLDGIAAVSRWQAGTLTAQLGVEPALVRVLPNAIGPAFQALPGTGAIRPRKAWPPRLAYTSAPHRGLERLLLAFPHIQREFPEARLDVYSSMVPHSIGLADDPHAALYQRCQTMPGVTYAGSVGQAALAAELAATTVLAYPNIYGETFCIAALEALAAGCLVVSSDYCALPETCAGHALLIEPVANPFHHALVFAGAVRDVLRRWRDDPEGIETQLAAQVGYAQAQTWAARARDWTAWLA